MLDHHLHPRTPAEVATEVAAAGAPRSLLVCTGQYAPQPAATQRVLVLGDDGAARVYADAWMTPAAIDELLARLRGVTVRTGRCDAMYATSWSVAWASDEGDLEVWDAGGRVLWQQYGTLVHRTRGRLPHACEVHATLSSGWVERSVVLRLADGSVCEVAACSEEAAALDPTYDALDLLMDASWMLELTRELGVRLGIATVLDPALR